MPLSLWARPKDKQDWEQTQRTKEDKGQRRAQIGQRTSKTGSTKAAQSQDEVDQEEGRAKEVRAKTRQFRTKTKAGSDKLWQKRTKDGQRRLGQRGARKLGQRTGKGRTSKVRIVDKGQRRTNWGPGRLRQRRPMSWAEKHIFGGIWRLWEFDSQRWGKVVSFTNPLADGSGLVERTPKKVGF